MSGKPQSSSDRKALPQAKESLLKTYQVRLRDGVQSMLENYSAIARLCKVSCHFYSRILFLICEACYQ